MTRPFSTTRRRILIDALAGAGTIGLLPVANAMAASAQQAGRAHGLPDIEPPTGDLHDFDFFVGKWNGTNRRLKKRWVGSDDWDVFPGSLTCGSHLGGVVNLDYDVEFPTKGWSGMTVRTFHLETRQWYLYWINSKTGELFPPVVGGFDGDRGEFYGDDTDEGRPVKIKFLWTRFTPDHARWQQAFSLDGKEWETNWICDHHRAKA
ncbi:hypothetical protein M2650_14220 [Luteimonas sp. SX5]|uniref:DUF1579 domain-containing protein n=1 Tax=Luteimonas galliterrae TaxID=2940486 RepID=A0ABT0MLN3_9GAMM|nr:hypothetical protein [Luteimonas galliterrae]MCL1635782.1 hypothetical protein [Luteimonas galliterrae]